MVARPAYQVYTEPLIQGAGDAIIMTPTNVSTGDSTARITLGIWVGSTGDLHVVFADQAGGAGVTIPNVQGGSLLPFRAVRIGATNTTAGGIIGLYSNK